MAETRPSVELSSVGPTSVAAAAAELKQEHRDLELLAERLRSAAEIGALVKGLEDLSRTLNGHFAHEEGPDGLYDALGACVPENRERLARLVDEHFRMSATARGLAERARRLQAEADALRRDAAVLLDQLKSHEQQEHALVRETTESGAGR